MTGSTASSVVGDLEAACGQAEQVGELGLGGHEHVVGILALGHQRPEAVQARQVAAPPGRRGLGLEPSAGQLAHGESHQQEEHRGLHVVA